jgi:hypothetical protein
MNSRQNFFDGKSVSHKAATYTQDNTNTETHAYTPRVGFESTIPVVERAQMVHTSERAFIVIGETNINPIKKSSLLNRIN